MSKFVLMTGEEDYEKYIFNTAKNDPNVVERKQLQTNIIKKLFRFHNAWPANKICEMPFKSIWYSRILDESELDIQEKLFFIFYESFHFSFSGKYLRYLKNKYKNSVFCFAFHNPVNGYNLNKLEKVRKYYDEIITFFEDDAKRYKLLKPEYFPYQLPVDTTRLGEKSDVFFIGSDKGRLSKLIKIFEKLKAEGLKCLFYIVGVPKEKQKYRDEIRYNQVISYEKVLEHVKATKCVLEVLQDKKMYSSIRTFEAFQYKKKLLTTNKRIVQEPFYNPNIIRVIDEEINIDKDFVLSEPHDEDFPDPYYWSFASFKKCVEENAPIS
jgi:hypothetical protein